MKIIDKVEGGGHFMIRGDAWLCQEVKLLLQEDYMKAVRKLNDAKKLEGTLSYDSAFGDGGRSK